MEAASNGSRSTTYSPTAPPSAGPTAGRRFFFFHVSKTGGSTVCSALARYAGDTLVLPRKKRGSLVDVAYRRKCLPFQSPSDLPHLAGHFASLSAMRGADERYYKACFWRHPADWHLSYYNWRRSRERDRLRRPYSFSDFAGTLLRNPMTQEFLLYCGDMPGWRYFFSSDREKFDRALALATRFDVFADISGVNSYLTSTGLAETGAVERRNSVPEREKALARLDAKTRHELEREHPVDFFMSRIARGESRATVVAEAHRALCDRFQWKDLVRQLIRPYYRFKVLVVPFVGWQPAPRNPRSGFAELSLLVSANGISEVVTRVAVLG